MKRLNTFEILKIVILKTKKARLSMSPSPLAFKYQEPF